MRTRLLFLFCLLTLAASAQQENKSFLSLGGGFVFPGPLTDSMKFHGREISISFGYSWFPSKRFGLAPQFGASVVQYSVPFRTDVSLLHRQTGINLVLPAFFQFTPRLRLSAGIYAFFPLSDAQEIATTYYNMIFYMSPVSITEPYVSNRLQAGPLLGMDYAPGKKKLFSFGMQVMQMANSAVRTRPAYADGFGDIIQLQNNDRPLHFMVKLQFVVTKSKSKKDSGE